MACGLLFARLRPIHEKVSVLRRRLLGSRITLAWTTCAKRVVQGEAHFYRPDMEFALRLLRRNGFQPNAVIDVGAYKGDWALLCRGVFSDARVLMVEPSAERMRGLRKLRANVAGLDVRQALLGAREDMLLFR